MPLSKKALENKKKYSMEYAKQKYKRIPLDVTMRKYDEIKNAAQKANEPVNTYIKNAIDARMQLEKE